MLPCSVRPPGPCPQPPSSISWLLAWSSSSQVWQAPTLKAKHSPQHRGAGWKYHEQRRMAPEHAMQAQGPAEGSQGLTTPLVSPGLQAIVMSHAQGHVHSSGTSIWTTTKPGTPTHAGGSAQPFPALSHFVTPGDQQRTCSAPLAARECQPQPRHRVQLGPLAQEGHLTHGHPGAWPGACSAVPAREGAWDCAGEEGLGWLPASMTAVRGAVPGDMQSLEQDAAPRGLS